MCRLSPREWSTGSPGRASEPTSRTRRGTRPSDGADTPSEGHQPPTTRHLGAFTARVTSLPRLTTAIGTPFHDATEPLTMTGPAALTGLRLSSALAAEGDDGTVPPKYNGLMTAASSAGIPAAVNGAGLAAAVIAGTAGFVTALGGEEHPLNDRAPTRSVDSPTERTGRDKDSETRGMSPPYVVPTARPHVLLTLPPGRCLSRRRRSTSPSLLVRGNRSRDRVLDVADLDVTVLDVAWRYIQLGVRSALERERLVFLRTVSADHDDLAGLELTVENLLRKDVLDLALDRATQGTRAEHPVVA